MHLLETFLYTVLPFLVILSVLIYFHELGHYWVAKKNGVRVEVFSIGFGPELFGWTNKAGTRWKVSLLPLGGYVKMFSDLNPASQPDMEKISQMSEADKKASLFHKPVGVRMAVSAAGPLANYGLAICLLGFLYAFSGQPMPSEVAQIGRVMPESAAEKAGLVQNDVVLSLNGEATPTFEAFHDIIKQNPGKSLQAKVLRGEQEIELTLTPKEISARGTTYGQAGVERGSSYIVRPVYSTFYYAAVDSMKFTYNTLKSLGQMLIGKESANGLSGPIGIAALTGDVAKKSLWDLIWFTALLSINLGLLNLFPVPMLDGGHLLFYSIEAIRGKPVSEAAQEWGYRIGFTLVIGLLLFATWNDLVRLQVFAKLIDFLKNIFM